MTRRLPIVLTRKAKTISGRANEIRRNAKHAEMAKAQRRRVIKQGASR